MAPSHASPATRGLPLLSSLPLFLLLGCTSREEPTVSISAHSLPGCGPLPREARLELGALGEFPESLLTKASIPIAEPADLTIPAETLAIEASASFGDERFWGFSERAGQSDVPLLLWPENESCRLGGSARYPVVGGGQAVGYSSVSRTLLVAGGSATNAPSASVALLAFHAGTGSARVLATAADATLAEARAFATVTPFGARLLVAGGENPIHGDSAASAPPRKTAEVFDPATGGVEPSLIQLQEERTRHAATVLPNGDTLLVGGRGVFGDPLLVLETVSPETGSNIAGLASLAAARLSPSLLRLDDGRLFVGGGTAADGTPLSVLEWFSPDALERLATAFPPELPARFDRAFAALPGGGVLIVGGCEVDPLREPDCGSECGHGCPPLDGYDLWWVDASGGLTRFDLDFPAPRPVLLDGGDGRPWLVSGAPEDNVLRRFNPWQAIFEPTDLTLASLPRWDLPATKLDTQAFVWLVEGEPNSPFLAGARLGTRSRYARDISLIAESEDPTQPLGLVPDRPLAGQASYDGALHFVAGSEVAIFVQGTDYADVTVTLEIEPGRLPLFVLGTLEFGGDSCPWPDPAASRLELRRLGTRVVLSSAPPAGRPQTTESEGDSVECVGPAGRVRVGVRGGPDGSDLRRLDLRRGG